MITIFFILNVWQWIPFTLKIRIRIYIISIIWPPVLFAQPLVSIPFPESNDHWPFFWFPECSVGLCPVSSYLHKLFLFLQMPFFSLEVLAHKSLLSLCISAQTSHSWGAFLEPPAQIQVTFSAPWAFLSHHSLWLLTQYLISLLSSPWSVCSTQQGWNLIPDPHCSPPPSTKTQRASWITGFTTQGSQKKVQKDIFIPCLPQ